MGRVIFNLTVLPPYKKSLWQSDSYIFYFDHTGNYAIQRAYGACAPMQTLAPLLLYKEQAEGVNSKKVQIKSPDKFS